MNKIIKCEMCNSELSDDDIKSNKRFNPDVTQYICFECSTEEFDE
jgi:hypothetical protein